MYDGPDEVHRVSVARQVLAGYQPPKGMWPREHVPTRRAAAQRKFASLLEAATTDA
jgi:acyl-CoA dehydrogenase